jgi:hypothetical protein
MTNDDGLLTRLRDTHAQLPSLQLAVVAHTGARNIDLLAKAGVAIDRFLDIEQIETHLRQVIDGFQHSSVHARVFASLAAACSSKGTKHILAQLLNAKQSSHTVQEIAGMSGCTTKQMRQRLQRDLGIMPKTLLRWSTTIRAIELSERGQDPIEVAAILGVDCTTIERSVRPLLNMSFREASRRGSREAANQLAAQVAARSQSTPRNG